MYPDSTARINVCPTLTGQIEQNDDVLRAAGRSDVPLSHPAVEHVRLVRVHQPFNACGSVSQTVTVPLVST